MKIDSSLKIVKGMRDIGINESELWLEVEACLIKNFKQFSYHSIRTPILEKMQLFVRSVGENTDIVAKEMFHFVDQGKDHLCLRPELTAPIVRSLVESGNLRSLPLKVFSIAPAFRRERPQKGRYRQFHQADVEVFGIDSFEIEVELILLAKRIFNQLGIKNIKLEINSLGDKADRKKHSSALIDYFKNHLDELDESSKNRLHTNPLRILDSKNLKMKKLIAGAPKIEKFINNDAAKHFKNWQNNLTELGIEFKVNPNLVRGLDYYNRSVFEWIAQDDELGSGTTICGGGRYDYLVSEITNNQDQKTAAIGFAIGLDRLILLVQKQRELNQTKKPIDKKLTKIIIINADPNDLKNKTISLDLLNQITTNRTDFIVENFISSKKINKQFAKAKQSQARIIITLSKDIKKNWLSIKDTKTNQNFNIEAGQFINWFNQNYPFSSI